MGVFTDEIAADFADWIREDGDEVTVVSATQRVPVQAFWKGLSLRGEQDGPEMVVVTEDLPSDFTQGNSVIYDSATYTVTHRQPHGHGTERISLLQGW